MTTAIDVFSKLARLGIGANDSGALLDLCADDVVFEFPFAPPGRPTRVEGKPALGDYLRALSSRVRLDGVSNLEIHETDLFSTMVNRAGPSPHMRVGCRETPSR